MRDINGNTIRVGDKVRRLKDYKYNGQTTRMYAGTLHTVSVVGPASHISQAYDQGYIKVESDPGHWGTPSELEIVQASPYMPIKTPELTGTFFVAQIIESSNGETYSRKGDLFDMKFSTYDAAEKKALALSEKTGNRYAVTQLHARVAKLPVYKTTVERL